MADREHPLPQSNAESQPFDASMVPATYVTLVQPRLFAAASQLRGGLYGYRSRMGVDSHRRALAQRYGLERADDEATEEMPLRDEWDR